MKVTIIYQMIIDGPNYCTEKMYWSGDLTDGEYEKIQVFKMEHKYEYEEQCDVDEENDVNNSDVLALNYEVLQEALPEWCEKTSMTIVGETYNEVSNEIGANIGSDLKVLGCWFEKEEEDDDEPFDFDFDDNYNEEDYGDEDGIGIILRYYVAFGGGDYTEEMEWRTFLSNDQYELYQLYMRENPGAENNYETLQVLYPEWICREYGKIVHRETESFLSSVDPDDWNCADDMLEPDWRVTDCYTVEIIGFDIES